MAVSDHFQLAYVFFTAFAVWKLGYWLTSDFLVAQERASKRIKHKRRETPETVRHKVKRQRCQYLLIQWGGIGVVAVVALSCLFVTYRWQEQWRLKQFEAVLIAANDPDPPTGCQIPPSAMRFYLGKLTIFSEGDQLRIVEKLEPKEKNRLLLGVKREGDGIATFTAHIVGQDEKEIVNVDKNVFEINRNAIFDSLSPPRSDRSTISIKDEYGNQLTVRYLNNHSFSFTGKIFYRPGAFIQIDDNGLTSEPIEWGIRGGGCIRLSNPEEALVTVQP